ncbi:MAG: hypothetical protein AAF518_02305 [Spirochaetota bacterium]
MKKTVIITLLFFLLQCSPKSDSLFDNTVRLSTFLNNSSSETLSLSITGSLSQDGTTVSNTLITTSASTLSTSTSEKERSTGSNTIRCVDYNLSAGSLTCYFIIYTANISGATSGCFHLYYSSGENKQLQSIAKFHGVTVGSEITLFHEEEIPTGANGFTVYSCNDSSEKLLSSETLTDYASSDGILTDSDGNYTVSVETGKYHTLSIRRPTKDLGDITIDLSTVTTEDALNEIKNDSSKLPIAIPSGFTHSLTVNGPTKGSTGSSSTSAPTTGATVDFNTFSTEIGKDAQLTPGSNSSSTYTVGGNIIGLSGTVSIQNNGTDTQTYTTNGSFTFPSPLASGSSYSVTVTSHPTNQTCIVTSGTGTLNTNTTSVVIQCARGGTGTIQWAKTVTSGSDNSLFHATAIDPNENIYVAGYITGTSASINFGLGAVTGTNSAYSGVLVKYDSNGNVIWSKTPTGGTGESEFFTISTDSSGNVYTGGQIKNTNVNFGSGNIAGAAAAWNALVVKYDTNGNAQWANTTSTAAGESFFFDVAADASGNLYAAGQMSTNGTYNFGSGNITSAGAGVASPLLVKYNSSGTAQWAVTASVNPGGANWGGVAVNASSGAIYVVGQIYSNGTFTFGGNNISGANASNNNAIIAKYDSNGNVQWVKSVPTAAGHSSFHELTIDSSGNVYAIGTMYGGTFNFGGGNINGAYASGVNGVIVKYDSNGNVVWNRTIASATNPSSYNDISIDAQNNLYIAGSLTGTSVFNFGTATTTPYYSGINAFIIKYDSNGNDKWAHTTVGSATSVSDFYGVVTNSYGNTYTVGYMLYNGNYDFGTGNINGTNSGGYNSTGANALIIKYE